MYHRVVDPSTLPFPIEPGMYVRPQTFAQQMAILAKNYSVIPLDKLISDVLAGTPLPAKSVALTFDDGWLDTYQNAYPILKRLALPATVFLPTAYIGSNRRFSYDKLSALLFSKKDNAAEELSRKISQLKSLSREAREQELSRLLQAPEPALGHAAAEVPTKTRDFINWDEVREMANNGISFASHSHEHQLFSELSEEEILADLTSSLDSFQLQQITPSPIFCFPNGQYSERARSSLLQLGFKAAVITTRAGDLTPPLALFGRVGIHEDMTSSHYMFITTLLGLQLRKGR